MVQQKVIKVGNSLAVTLPKEFVKSSHIKAGQQVLVEADPQQDVIQIRTKEGSEPSLTPEFKKWLDGISTKYESLIKELAKK